MVGSFCSLLFARLDSRVRVEGTPVDSQDRSYYNVVIGVALLSFGNSLISVHYTLSAGVCCHFVILSHFHSFSNRLTLSLIHT